MRIVPLLTAIIVVATLYALVFERDAILALAGAEEAAPETPSTEAAAEAPTDAIGVVAVASQSRVVDGIVLLRGRTEAARSVVMLAETSGRVVSPPLRKGAAVDEGDVLCRLDPGTREAALIEAEARLPEAAARLAEAEARLAEAQINDRAARSLSEGGFASETRVAATAAAVESARAAVESARVGLRAAEAGVAAARVELDRLTVTAPFAGLLETDSAELGALLQPGSPCAEIIRLDPIRLVAFAPEADVARVAIGARAGGRLSSGREVLGTVTFVSRSADEETRTFRVEIEVPNPDAAIRAGETVEVGIESDGLMAHLLPASALTLDDDGALGVRVVEDGAARFHAVELIRDTPEGVWLTGLPDQAQVIVVGQEYVTDGTPVAVTLREAAP